MKSSLLFNVSFERHYLGKWVSYRSGVKRLVFAKSAGQSDLIGIKATGPANFSVTGPNVPHELYKLLLIYNSMNVSIPTVSLIITIA